MADGLWFASAAGRALRAWREAAALGAARRAALAHVVVLVHDAELLEVMAGAFDAWATRAARRRGVRDALISFVGARRRAALCEYLGYWRQYAAAMRTDVGAMGGAPPALLAPRSAHHDRRLIRRMALLRGSVEVRLGQGVLPGPIGVGSAASGSPGSPRIWVTQQQLALLMRWCHAVGAVGRRLTAGRMTTWRHSWRGCLPPAWLQPPRNGQSARTPTGRCGWGGRAGHGKSPGHGSPGCRRQCFIVGATANTRSECGLQSPSPCPNPFARRRCAAVAELRSPPRDTRAAASV
jgi:hypothetical protein